MPFCRECGAKLNGDERFCGSCGAAASNSEDNQKTTKTLDNVKPSVNTDILKVYFGECLKIFKLMALAPVSSINEVCSNLKKESAYILLGCLSFLYAAINLLGINSFIKYIEKSSSSLISKIVPGMSLFSGEAVDFIDKRIPRTNIFFLFFFAFIIGVLIILVVNIILGKYIFKASTGWGDIFKVAVVSSIPFFIASLLFILLSFISIYLSLPFMFIGIIVSIISLYSGLVKVFDISENKVAFFIPISLIIMLFVNAYFIGAMIKSIFRSISQGII